ncbi:TraB/GumN family protein [Noviherbaspirillum saxi]|uniref:TraB/GumN family protein n=2 Tax=Noviherbaspirillum saxi TaxID=2320863 RepID=A0A3A3GG62_9BURK|nr:TraB/GumN family protein [Noviherbaspirillum saxi]
MPAAHAENNATAAASAQAALAATGMSDAPQRGSLYRIRHHGNIAWLFGTIHVGKPAFYPLEQEVTTALQRAGKLVLEIDIRDNGPFQRALHAHGMYPSDDGIEGHLSAESLASLRKALEQHGISLDSVRRFKPWLLANMLIGLDLERHGYHRSHGLESFLLAQAGHAKAVQELESAEYQMSLYDGMSDAMQEQYLRENLAELADGNALRKAQALIDAWSRADGNAVERFILEAANEKTASSDFLQKVLLDRRNPEMANKIEALLRNEESSFVGVGLLHLMGETGLPKLLRERGYEVEKLY